MIKEYQQFDLCNKKVFEKAVFEPPFRVSAVMPNEACFYYLIRGNADMYTPNGRVTVTPEEGLVLKCGNYLNDFLSNTDTEYCEAVAIHFYPEILKMMYEKEFPEFLKQMDRIKPARYERVKSSALLQNYVDSLQFYFQNPELVSEELLFLKLKELILLLAKTDNAEAIRTLFHSLFTPAEIDFKALIEANLFNNLSIEELATLSNLSLSSFKREFVKHYDNSPARYIKSRRLQKAAQLLENTSLRVSDVAFDTGFTDLAHFSKSFLKEYGASPTDYRSNFLNKSLS